MIKMTIAIDDHVSLSALNKPNLLYISSTQSARIFKGNPFLYF